MAEFRVSFESPDPRMAQVLSKLPPVRLRQRGSGSVSRVRSKVEFDAMRGHFRDALWAAQAGKCAHCGKPFARQATLDHVVPLSRGGPNWIGNLLLMHRECNGAKGDRMPSRALSEALEAVNATLQSNPFYRQWFEVE